MCADRRRPAAPVGDLDDLLPRLQRLLRRTTPRLRADVPTSSDFRTDLHFDSLDLVEFVSRIEVEFALQIPDDHLQRFLTLDAIASYLGGRLLPDADRRQPRTPLARAIPSVTPTPAPSVPSPRTAARRRPRVVITGVGVVSPLGTTVDQLWSRLLAGDTAVRRWDDLAAAGFRVTAACRVADFESAPLRRGRTLGAAAAAQAVAAAGATLPEDTGVFVGSTIGESLAFEQSAEGRRLRLEDYTVSSFARGVARHFGLAGVTEAVGTACAAGNYAVGAAVAAVRDGRVPMAIAGGVEPFSRLAMVGFSRARAMARDTCRPFDRGRDGMLLGEGAAMFVLERVDRAMARGATPLAEVVALGLSADAYHPTAPEPSGEGMARAMRAALDLAGLLPEAVDWVNAHGSGTRASDAAEASALRLVFGDRLPVVSGSKGAVGHALGAASALELAICVQGLQQQTVPPTAGHADADGVCCTTAATPLPLRTVMNNAFAFGGLNSALILRAWEP